MNGIYGVGFIRTTLKQIEMSDQRTTTTQKCTLGWTTGGACVRHDRSASCISAEVSPPKSENQRWKRSYMPYVNCTRHTDISLLLLWLKWYFWAHDTELREESSVHLGLAQALGVKGPLQWPPPPHRRCSKSGPMPAFSQSVLLCSNVPSTA